MTKIDLVKTKEGFVLDISEINHIFVCEDETAAEFKITKGEAKEAVFAMLSKLI